jgi:hypothetical protein
MPKAKAMALKPPTITRLQGKSSFRMGPPPAPGKPVTTGKSVAVGGRRVGVDVGVAVGVDVGVDVGVGVAVGVDMGVDVVVDMGVDGVVDVGAIAVCVSSAAQIGLVMVLLSNVTAPVCTRARPFKLAPVCRAMDVSARIFPMNLVPGARREKEEPILHHTLHGSPPVTDELAEVVSVDADLKIQTPEDPLSVRFPVSMKAVAQ